MKNGMRRVDAVRRLYAAGLLILLMCMFTALTSVRVYADEDDDHTQHTWVKYDDEYKEYSDTQHEHIIDYYCSTCNEVKTETFYEDHDFKKSDDEYEEYSDTQHKHIIEYSCEICEAEKTETLYEDHDFEDDVDDEYKSVSASRHSYREQMHCRECYADAEETRTAAHNYNKYGVCKECGYIKPREITLSAGKTAYVTSKTWMKVTVKKNGYLILSSSKKLGFLINLYDKSKRVYAETSINIYGGNKGYVPVTKGTWYLKLEDGLDDIDIKYSFKKAPSASNYTRAKAAALKKGRTATGVIYSSAKKSTWKRYYKIKLTKKQFLKVTGFSTTGWVYIDVQNSKGELIGLSTDYDNKKNPIGWISSKKLSGGTYYIVVTGYWTDASKKNDTGGYYSFKWS